MKYITAPIHLLKFWYIESIDVFFRTWKNLILFLEEDLAVGLMWKLLFVPLFHDSSIVGRVLSVCFRMGRVTVGIFAFILGTVFLIALAAYWLFLPILVFLDLPEYLSRILFFGGVGLFIIHIATHPHKKVWQVKGNPWDASTVKSSDLSFKNLLETFEVKNLLAYLEIQLDHLPLFEIQDKDQLIKKAFELAKKAGSEYIRPSHFFVAALTDIPQIDQFLLKLDLKVTDFEQVLNYLEKKRNTWRKVYIWDEYFGVHHLKGVNRGWLGAPTPILDLVGEDLTRHAASTFSSDFIRSNGVVEGILNILSQTTGRNVILIGPPGVGKSALIHHLAKQIVRGDAPSILATKRLVLLDLTKLVSGANTEGELAQKVKTIFEEVSYAQNVIIALEEIHDLGMGEASKFNLYSLILPYLEKDEFQFIATTENENYSRIIEKNGSFARLFVKIELPAATVADTLSILEERAIETERSSKVLTSYVAMKTAVELAQKLVHDRVLPDCAISIFKEAQTRSFKGWVTKEIVKQTISTRVKVPLADVGTLNKEKLLTLETQIHGKLIDQEQAVKLVSDTLRRSATGIREENRPIGSFLFVGPTGVGKTELAKALAQVYFKPGEHLRGENEVSPSIHLGGEGHGAFIRFDMSEYQNQESVARLIGGSGEGGQLTEAVRQKPYCLLLLDEFEKADPKILTLFLQVLEDGRLTDGASRLIDFTNTIIIATSNVASLIIAQGLGAGKSMDEIDKEVNDELLKTFKPELINRFDDVVIFKPLSPQDLQKIVNIKIKTLQNQMREKGYILEFDEDLLRQLAERGFDPVLGARPLRRLIQDTLEANLSRLILENKLVKGNPFKIEAELLN